MHDAILTAIDNVVLSRVEMAEKLTTGSTGHETKSEVQNPDQRDFLGNIRNNPLMLASSRLDLHNELNWNDDTRMDVNFEDGDFPALKFNYERRVYAHHMVTGHNAPHKNVPENLTGRFQTQNNPLPQQYTQTAEHENTLFTREYFSNI